eukprot:2913990-Pleurochrysis_carterae.AAC.1
MPTYVSTHGPSRARRCPPCAVVFAWDGALSAPQPCVAARLAGGCGLGGGCASRADHHGAGCGSRECR